MNNNKGNDGTSFGGKIALLLHKAWEQIRSLRPIHRINSRQKSLADYHGEGSPEEARLSYVFGILKVVFISVLCLVLCLTVVLGQGIITYENVYYMFKDIEYIKSFDESVTDQLNYSKPIALQDFEVFKNGLAVASDSEIKLFTSTGRVTMTRGSEYSNPKLCASGNSLLVYDQGNRSYSIYNSFTELHREKLDFPISSAAMAKNGSYAIVTRSPKYTSVVKVYNSSGALDMEYSKNDYVISADLSDDARHLSVLSMSASGGESLVALTVVDVSRGEVRSEHKLTDVMPYTCEFISGSRLVAYYADHVTIYDYDLSIIGEYVYPSTLNKMHTSSDGIVLCMAGDGIASSNSVVVIDQNARVVYTGTAIGDVYDICLAGGYVYVLTGDAVSRYDTRFGGVSTVKFDGEDSRLAIFEGGKVAVCTTVSAHYITFD